MKSDWAGKTKQRNFISRGLISVGPILLMETLIRARMQQCIGKMKKKMVQDIEIVEANAWIRDIFASNPGWKNGVIKIDVEGFELHIFEALLSHIPKDVSVVVIMENFPTEIDYQSFKSRHHQLEWYGFYKQKQYLKSVLFKLLGMSSYYKQTVNRIDQSKNAPHDLIVYFKPV